MVETLLIYNAILVLAVVSAVGVKACQGWGEWGMRLLLLLVLTVPAVLRYNVGTDYSAYVQWYGSSIREMERVEIGYALVNSVLHGCGAPVEVMFALMSLLTYIPIAFFVRKKYIIPVVLMYMLTAYLASYSLVRQAVAISWVVVAMVRYCDDQHIGRLYLTIAGACMFHLSAVIILPFVLIRRVHISVWILLLLLPVAYYLISHGATDAIFDNALFLDSKYGMYTSTSFIRKTEMGSSLGVLLKMIIPLMYLVLASKLDRQYDILLYLSAAFIVAVMLSTQIHIFNRLADILSVAPIVGFAVMYEKLRKPLYLSLVSLLMIVNLQKTITANTLTKGSGLGITPYVTIFEK